MTLYYDYVVTKGFAILKYFVSDYSFHLYVIQRYRSPAPISGTITSTETNSNCVLISYNLYKVYIRDIRNNKLMRNNL